MENISTGPTFEDFVTFLTEGMMQDNTVSRLQSNVLLESLSEDCENIPCATLKRRESWVNSIYLWLYCTDSPRSYCIWQMR
jgi:hypothetical protein